MRVSIAKARRMPCGRGKDSRSGFTLMEVALAIMVMAIGVVATFALVISGLDSNMGASADTRAAIFADNVFNALRAESRRSAAESDAPGVYWRDFWMGFAMGKSSVPFSAEPAWAGTPGNEWDGVERWRRGKSVGADWVTVEPSDSKYPMGIMAKTQAAEYYRVRFNNAPFEKHSRGDKGLANHAFRYHLEVTPIPGTMPPRMDVVLMVWDGMYGSLAETDANVFYSRYAYTGNL